MGDMKEVFQEMKSDKKEKKAMNRETSKEYLNKSGIVFTEHNGGAHLIVEDKDCYIDFWPGTGRWKTRKGVPGFGVKNLVSFINE